MASLRMIVGKWQLRFSPFSHFPFHLLIGVMIGTEQIVALRRGHFFVLSALFLGLHGILNSVSVGSVSHYVEFPSKFMIFGCFVVRKCYKKLKWYIYLGYEVLCSKILWYFHICVLMFLLVYSAASKCELCYMNMLFMQLSFIFFTKIDIDRIVRLTPFTISNFVYHNNIEICQILRSLLITC